MDKFNDRYRIKSNRLQKWNYSWAGAYYITICTYGRENRFGDLINKELSKPENEKIAYRHWYELPDHYPCILDEFVVMPNHIHFIIILTGNDNRNNNVNRNDYGNDNVETIHELSLHSNNHLHSNNPHHPQSSQPPQQKTKPQKTQQPLPSNITTQLYNRRGMVLSKIIGRFKMNIAKEINLLEQTTGQPFWQIDYYDHIIRNNNELERIRKYIRENPMNWDPDNNNTGINM